MSVLLQIKTTCNRRMTHTLSQSLFTIYFLIFVWSTFFSHVDKSEKPHDQVMGTPTRTQLFFVFLVFHYFITKKLRRCFFFDENFDVVATKWSSLIPCFYFSLRFPLIINMSFGYSEQRHPKGQSQRKWVPLTLLPRSPV